METWSSRLGVGRGATTPHQKRIIVTKPSDEPRKDGLFGNGQNERTMTLKLTRILESYARWKMVGKSTEQGRMGAYCEGG
jgi:hypothetical protein